MREKPKDIPVHTEHLLFECTVSDLNAGDLRLFRAPTVHDGSGTYKRLPHEITLNDLRADDMVVALHINERGNEKTTISNLQFWRVLEAQHGEARILVNNLVGSSGDGEYVYDRLAGMVGLPPSPGKGD